MSGPVSSRVSKRVGSLLAAGLLVTLAGCSGDDTGPDIEPSAAASAPASSAAATPTVSTLPVPAGVELTTQGSQLAVGDTATVAYQPRQDTIGVLDITVKRLEQTTLKKSFAGWQLDDAQKASNPYFVRATITNRGETDLGGRRAPLYIVDATNTLVESTSFSSAFTACEPGNFPESFPPGAKAQVCLVYLAPNAGELTAVSFRPSQEVDPITWTGTLEKPKKPKQPQQPETPDGTESPS